MEKILRFSNSKRIKRNIALNKKSIKIVFKDKLKLIESLIDFQVQLTDLYFRQRMVKNQLSEVYHDNHVEDMTLFNQINLHFSILSLIQQDSTVPHGYYCDSLSNF